MGRRVGVSAWLLLACLSACEEDPACSYHGGPVLLLSRPVSARDHDRLTVTAGDVTYACVLDPELPWVEGYLLCTMSTDSEDDAYIALPDLWQEDSWEVESSVGGASGAGGNQHTNQAEIHSLQLLWTPFDAGTPVALTWLREDGTLVDEFSGKFLPPRDVSDDPETPCKEASVAQDAQLD